MSVNRRSLLKSVAVAPLAAAIPSAAASAQVTEAITAVVAPAKPFQWWISFDGGDVFSDWFASKEDALKALADCGGGMIAECQRQDYDLSLDGDQIIELWAENNAELIGEGEFASITSEQADELSKLLTGVAYAWAEKHKLDLEAWTFGKVRNQIKASDLVLPASPKGAE